MNLDILLIIDTNHRIAGAPAYRQHYDEHEAANERRETEHTLPRATQC